MRKQLSVYTSLIFFSVLTILCIGCGRGGFLHNDFGNYCTSGTRTCYCGKPKLYYTTTCTPNETLISTTLTEPALASTLFSSEYAESMSTSELSHTLIDPMHSTTITTTEHSTTTIPQTSYTATQYTKTVTEPVAYTTTTQYTTSSPGYTNSAQHSNIISESSYSKTSMSEPASSSSQYSKTESTYSNTSNSKATTESSYSNASNASQYSKTESQPAYGSSTTQTSKTVSQPAYSSSTTQTSKTVGEPAYGSSTTQTSKTVSQPAYGSSTTQYSQTASQPNYSKTSNAQYSRTTTEPAYNSASSNESSSAYSSRNSKNESNEKPSYGIASRVMNREDRAESGLSSTGCKYNPSCEFSTGVRVRAKNPKMCQLGSQYPVEFELLATSDVRDVVLTATIPDGTSYVSSQPEAKVSGRTLTWSYDQLNQGQTIVGKIVFKTEKQGELCSCFNVKASSNACCSIMCAEPVLTCEKAGGADEVCPGDQITYVVNVGNSGSYQAEDVILTITDTQSNQAAGSFKIGTLDKGQSRKVNFPVTATKRGKLTYNAVATSSNANKASCDLATLVTACAVESRKEGPKQAIIGQVAKYKITVTNTGDKVLHDVVVADTAHPSTAIIAAKDAEFTDKRAVWKLKELKPGEIATLNESVTCRVTGKFNSNVAVTSKENSNAACEFSTGWRGRAALDVSMSTSDNSIFVGETTRYKITVTNQGQEPDTNVSVTAIFPAGLVPVSSSGDSVGKINGQNVVFAPTNLGLRQTLTHYVIVKANESGDLRPKVQVSSDAIKAPITQEESLIVN